MDQNLLDAIATLIHHAEGKEVDPVALADAIRVARDYAEGEGVAFISEEEEKSPEPKIGLDTSKL
ncbi:hypothetical protein SAMN05216548_11462 [Faunimonas pinastri]|uniref:Uncharacterized protein n=1 Tax=Faunimonas pinastri TaxID=1855383 RepID=A0A1H9MV20_9HYPH|nr:hypothetical protein [Faunimonas pinastri]SER27518.1 hypothetical protein SAMN05216548_11462 [Faunimonas pinastri]